ncbi:hypothetical protein VaNZ11_016230, partial [Volvox africanus]
PTQPQASTPYTACSSKSSTEATQPFTNAPTLSKKKSTASCAQATKYSHSQSVDYSQAFEHMAIPAAAQVIASLTAAARSTETVSLGVTAQRLTLVTTDEPFDPS